MKRHSIICVITYFFLVVGKTLSDTRVNESKQEQTNDRDARIASLEEIIDQHKYGDKHHMMHVI